MNKKILMLSILMSCIYFPAQAASITVDGDLADWGLKKNGNVDDWKPYAFVPPSQYFEEDQTNYYLAPGYGGQAYDAEALYTFMDNTNLYIALVTGLSPNTPNIQGRSYGPGDFAIDFGRDGSFEFGIQTTGPDVAKVYRDVIWDYGLWDKNNGEVSKTHLAPDPLHPTSIKSGTEVGIANLIYTDTAFSGMGRYINDYHYVIEAAIPLAAFSGFSGLFDIHWTMNCANDSISVDPVLARVPEPATLALLMLGLTGMAFFKRRNLVGTAGMMPQPYMQPILQ